ncbi:uncharacterized protein [Prorops nasuta]|uniref:uncharacterized protein n=1 Tax=Prorops nasuta TaxID=863751 RepID=UPI0034CDB868
MKMAKLVILCLSLFLTVACAQNLLSILEAVNKCRPKSNFLDFFSNEKEEQSIGCLVECILKELGALDSEGGLQLEPVEEVIDTILPSRIADPLKKGLLSCVPQNNSSQSCALGTELSDCLIRNNPLLKRLLKNLPSSLTGLLQ